MKAPLPPTETQRLEALRGYDVLDTPPDPVFDDLTLLAALEQKVEARTAELQREMEMRRVNETELAQFKYTLDHALDGVYIFHPDTLRFVYANHGALQQVGYSEDELLRMTPLDIKQEFTEQSFRAMLKQLLDGSKATISFETVHRHKDGHEIPVEIGLQLVRQGEQASRFIAFSRDITARRAGEAKIKRLTELYAALNQCRQAIVRCISEDELFLQICRAAVQFGGMKMAWVGMLDEASQRVKPVAWYGTGTEYLEGIQISVKTDEPAGRGGTGTAIRENRPVWNQDFQNDPRLAPWRERGVRAGWRATAALPLLRKGKVIGAFNLYAGEVNAFDETACNLLMEMARDIGQALDHFSLQAEQKQAEKALQDSEQRFRDFSRSTADWFWEMDADLRFTYISDNFERNYGLDRNRVLGKTRRALLATDNLNPPDILEAHLAQIDRHEPFRDFHYRIRNTAGHICWFSISGVPLFDPNGQFTGYRGMGQNATERQQAEEQLRIAAAAFESQEGMMVTDTDGVILRVNRAFTEITGYTAAEAVGQTPRLFQSGRHNKDFYRAMWESIHRTGGWQGEIWDRRKSGEIYPKWLTISAVKDDVGVITHYVGAHYDITERKNAEVAILNLNRDLSESRQHLRGLAAQNEEMRESERKHIAREVHDELGQVLTALRMDISLIDMRFGSLDPAVTDKVMDMRKLVDRAIQGVRNVAMNLRPPALDMGLVPAIHWLSNEFSRKTTIQCVLNARQEHIDLDEARAVVVFRIVQESLTNVTRYAEASLVNITIGHRGNELWVEVRDNGRGFDVDAVTKGKSFGLLGMRERALALGGQVDITSVLGQGTVIGLMIPIELASAEEKQ